MTDDQQKNSSQLLKEKCNKLCEGIMSLCKQYEEVLKMQMDIDLFAANSVVLPLLLMQQNLDPENSLPAIITGWKIHTQSIKKIIDSDSLYKSFGQLSTHKDRQQFFFDLAKKALNEDDPL